MGRENINSSLLLGEKDLRTVFLGGRRRAILLKEDRMPDAPEMVQMGNSFINLPEKESDVEFRRFAAGCWGSLVWEFHRKRKRYIYNGCRKAELLS